MSTLQLENIKRPKIDFKKLEIDEHAVLRARERFKRKDRDDALSYCRSLLGHSRYIGETTCERGNRAHMFVAPNKVAIYLTLDFREIKTLMKIDEKSYIVYDKQETSEAVKPQHVFSDVNKIPLQDKLIKLYNSEFKKHDRHEKKVLKEFTEFRLIASVEIANLRLEQFKCRGKAKKDKLQNQIQELEKEIIANELHLKDIQDAKRRISSALSTLLSEDTL
ncbi:MULTISPECIES: hypothetical protein [Paenibacillus]|uniref:hypothetical protein n=1 Tax=Paenibacillus TaxID=44249 RepID=UPI000B861F6B|nr:hypothetical protein [Paenibacillus amylolyticus]